jgi:hypothetical protein
MVATRPVPVQHRDGNRRADTPYCRP